MNVIPPPTAFCMSVSTSGCLMKGFWLAIYILFSPIMILFLLPSEMLLFSYYNCLADLAFPSCLFCLLFSTTHFIQYCWTSCHTNDIQKLAIYSHLNDFSNLFHVWALNHNVSAKESSRVFKHIFQLSLSIFMHALHLMDFVCSSFAENLNIASDKAWGSSVFI